jgi:hypothetical protein
MVFGSYVCSRTQMEGPQGSQQCNCEEIKFKNEGCMCSFNIKQLYSQLKIVDMCFVSKKHVNKNGLVMYDNNWSNNLCIWRHVSN